MGQVWKYLAVAGGEKVLEVAIAVTTGMALPAGLSDFFENPAIDEACLRLRVQLSIFAMTANTPQQWKAITAIRKRLRKLEGDGPHAIEDDRLACMEAFLGIPTLQQRESVPLIADAETVHLPTTAPEVPVKQLERIPLSWRSHAEDPDATDDRIVDERERCRVFVIAN